MRVGIYCNSFRPEEGGANSLVSTIIVEIKQKEDKNNEYVFICADKKDVPLIRYIDGFKYYNVNFNRLIGIDFFSRLSRIFNKEFSFVLEKLVLQEKIDIVLFTSPFYTGIRTPYIFPVWDLGHKTTDYSEVSKLYKRWGRDFMYRKMLSRAKYVLTGNETGRKEILKYYHVNEEQIIIAPFPVSSFCFGESIPPCFDVPKKYFFYPAQFWSHKNHIVIVRALKELKDKYNLEPICFFTGADYGSKEHILKTIDNLGLQNQIRITGFLQNEELKYLYENATAMVYASMMGPNNLPPIEAQYLGCPVIITNIDGHIEQMGDYAVYFDGNNPTELMEIMYRFYIDDEYRNSYVEKYKETKNRLENYKYIDSIQRLLE